MYEEDYLLLQLKGVANLAGYAITGRCEIADIQLEITVFQDGMQRKVHLHDYLIQCLENNQFEAIQKAYQDIQYSLSYYDHHRVCRYLVKELEALERPELAEFIEQLRVWG
ncbi:hypothetical protein NHG33_03640 [Aerococcaceae bacterium NML130460]|nr:hypothetical protein [Aerococcaceae bacterium NML130460]